MTIVVFSDYETLSRAVADRIGESIAKQPESLICLASGHTPLGVFSALAADVRNGRIQLGRCRFVSLDEWVGIPADNPGSCRAMMNEFFSAARIRDDQIHFFDGMAADPQYEAEKMNALISAHGGLDIMLVGIGLNGHIAMNEPGTPFDQYAHVSGLSAQTIAVGQKYFAAETKLSRGITLGLRHLSEAKLPVLMASGKGKAAIMKQSMNGPITPDVPASIVQTIPQAWVMTDGAAGSELGVPESGMRVSG